MSKKKLKKSPSLRCSAESEDSGLGLKVYDIYNQRMRKDKISGTLRPNFTKGSRSGFAVSGPTTTTNTPAKSIGKGSEQENLSRETSGKSQPKKYLSLIYLQQDFPVRLFPLQENVEVFKIKQGELFSTKFVGSLEIKDQATYSLRMLKDYFLMTKDEPSQLYSFRWMSLGMMRNGRCLTLSIGCPKTVRGSLSSVLEKRVDEKYYLSEKAMQFLIRRNEENKKAGRGFGADIQRGEKISSTIDARYGALRNAGESLIYEGAILSEKNKKWIKNGKKLSRNFPRRQRVYSDKGIASSICGDAGGLGGKTGLYLIRPCLTPDRAEKRQHGRRFKEHEEEMFTLTKQDIHGVQENRRIRRLTPRECERLQGFPDDWTKGVSDTQRYKQMGNAVSIPVVEAIGRKILEVIK